MFDALKEKNELIKWFKDEFKNVEGPAIFGLSGGKDSNILAAFLTEAIEAKNVLAIIMPNEHMEKLDSAIELCDYLSIKYIIHDINHSYNAIANVDYKVQHGLNRTIDWLKPIDESKINISPIIRMTVLKVIAQSLKGRTVNAINLSEWELGYFIKGELGLCDFAPFMGLTCTELIEVGKLLLPHKFVTIPPSDDLQSLTDEERFGFTYSEYDEYTRTGKISNTESKDKIDVMKSFTSHKRNGIIKYTPIFPYSMRGNRPSF